MFEKMSIAERAAQWDQIQSVKKQRNRESVIEQAVEELKAVPDDAVKSDAKVDPDWTTQFIDITEDVSDTNMQQLWAKLLAGEVKSPGSFSKRTLEIVKTFTKHEAEVFTRICSVVWHMRHTSKKWALTDQSWVHAVFNEQHNPLTFNYTDCLLMAEYGLIEISATYSTIWMPESGFLMQYFDEFFHFQKVKESKKMVQVNSGTFHLSEAGRQLAAIANPQKNEGYLKAILSFQTAQGWKISKVNLVKTITQTDGMIREQYETVPITNTAE
jgi:uncharacterized repeat protein (TIGR03899 family)